MWIISLSWFVFPGDSSYPEQLSCSSRNLFPLTCSKFVHYCLFYFTCEVVWVCVHQLVCIFLHAHMQYAFTRVSGAGRRVSPRNTAAYRAGGNDYTTRCHCGPSLPPKLTYGSVGSTTYSEINRLISWHRPKWLIKKKAQQIGRFETKSKEECSLFAL